MWEGYWWKGTVPVFLIQFLVLLLVLSPFRNKAPKGSFSTSGTTAVACSRQVRLHHSTVRGIRRDPRFTSAPHPPPLPLPAP